MTAFLPGLSLLSPWLPPSTPPPKGALSRTFCKTGIAARDSWQSGTMRRPYPAPARGWPGRFLPGSDAAAPPLSPWKRRKAKLSGRETGGGVSQCAGRGTYASVAARIDLGVHLDSVSEVSKYFSVRSWCEVGRQNECERIQPLPCPNCVAYTFPSGLAPAGR